MPSDPIPSDPAQAEAAGGMRALVVEPDRVRGAVLRSLLVRVGFAVEMASDAEAAARAAGRRTPDLAVLAADLPDRAGLAARLGGGRGARRIPVLRLDLIAGDDGAVSAPALLAAVARVLALDRGGQIELIRMIGRASRGPLWPMPPAGAPPAAMMPASLAQTAPVQPGA